MMTGHDHNDYDRVFMVGPEVGQDTGLGGGGGRVVRQSFLKRTGFFWFFLFLIR